jgi:hypothetical protein
MFWEPEIDGKNKIKINHAREREEGNPRKNRENKEGEHAEQLPQDERLVE